MIGSLKGSEYLKTGAGAPFLDPFARHPAGSCGHQEHPAGELAPWASMLRFRNAACSWMLPAGFPPFNLDGAEKKVPRAPGRSRRAGHLEPAHLAMGGVSERERWVSEAAPAAQPPHCESEC